MFKNSKSAAKTIAQTALRIAARHLIAAKPEAGLILTTVCALVTAGADASETDALDAIAGKIAEKYSGVFEKDPALKDDVADILGLMGIGDAAADVNQVASLAKTLCEVVS